MKRIAGARILLVAAGVALATAVPASAHHSASATYDADRSIVVRGRVHELAWRNPHCHLYLDVTEGTLAGRRYVVELSNPQVLVEEGWTRNMLRIGDEVVMTVHPARSGALIGLCRDCAFTINGQAAKVRVLPN